MELGASVRGVNGPLGTQAHDGCWVGEAAKVDHEGQARDNWDLGCVDGSCREVVNQEGHMRWRTAHDAGIELAGGLGNETTGGAFGGSGRRLPRAPVGGDGRQTPRRTFREAARGPALAAAADGPSSTNGGGADAAAQRSRSGSGGGTLADASVRERER